MEFSKQEDQSRLQFPIPGNLPDPEIEPVSPALAGRFFTPEPPEKPYNRADGTILVGLLTTWGPL